MKAASTIPEGRLTRVLHEIPRGTTHPRTIASISTATGITVRQIHNIVRTLVIKYGVPIGGLRNDGRHGLFIITNEDERAAAVIPLQNNAREIERRINTLQNIPL